jgi:hypothetical protein
MKSLYELTNGYVGESYVRCYAWAISVEQAVRLCEQVNGADKGPYKARELFNEEDYVFCTPLNDGGWPEDFDPLMNGKPPKPAERTK